MFHIKQNKFVEIGQRVVDMRLLDAYENLKIIKTNNLMNNSRESVLFSCLQFLKITNKNKMLTKREL